MKRSLLVALSVLVVGAACALPSSALAAEYTTYVGCSIANDAEPADTCQLGDSLGAFFEADEDTEYDVCVEFPGGEYLCALEQEAEEGVLYVNEITSEVVGLHYVDWYVDEELIATRGFELLAPVPPVAPPTTPPAAVVPAPVTPAPIGPSLACKRAKGKVERLKAKLGKAKGKKAKAKIRPKLRSAKADVKRRC